jgi:hypothetical protein
MRGNIYIHIYKEEGVWPSGNISPFHIWDTINASCVYRTCCIDVYIDIEMSEICTCVHIQDGIESAPPSSSSSYSPTSFKYNIFRKERDKYIAVELLVHSTPLSSFYFSYFTTPYGAHKWSALCISAVTDHCRLGCTYIEPLYVAHTSSNGTFFILTLHTHTHTYIVYLFILIRTCHLSVWFVFHFIDESTTLFLGTDTQKNVCVFGCVVRGNLFSHTSNNSSICFVIHWNTWMTFSLFYFYFLFFTRTGSHP